MHKTWIKSQLHSGPSPGHPGLAGDETLDGNSFCVKYISNGISRYVLTEASHKKTDIYGLDYSHIRLLDQVPTALLPTSALLENGLGGTRLKFRVEF